MSEILESEVLANYAPLLQKAADQFASDQIRNVATIGGNIANASPAADIVLPLMGLGGEIEICSKGEQPRNVALTDFFTGPGETKLEPTELISAIIFKTPESDFYGTFCKSGPRPALEISIVAMCLAGNLKNGILDNSRLIFGAVGPTPMRCTGTETLLNGRPIDDELIGDALDVMADEISPIDDFRASKWYRIHMARTFLEQELNKCRSR